MSLRILLVLNDSPLPFAKATGRWHYVLIRKLVEHGHRLTVFAACSKQADIDAARQLFDGERYDLRLFRHTQGRTLAGKWRTLRQPFSYMFSPEFRVELRRECARGYDILHLEETWAGWMGLGLNGRKSVLNILNLYDLDESPNTSVGLKVRAWRYWRRRAEHRILRAHPHLLALTPELRDAARTITPTSEVGVVPLGMDSTLYRFIPADRRQTAPVVTLIGSMNWTPSYSAAVRLLERLWPRIKAKVPGARVQIIGWNARTALVPFLDLPGVSVHENVPNTQPFFESASVLIYAPAQGSGMKVKIMEAFAYGVPVVTNRAGVEGLPALDGVHAGVADDDEGLGERAVELLQDHGRQERYRLAARRLIETHCDPERTVGAVEQYYAGMLR